MRCNSLQMFTNGCEGEGPALAPGDISSAFQALQGLLVFLCEYEKRIAELEQKTEERHRPKPKVVRTHRAMVRQVYGGKCPCCMKRMEDPQVDHFSSRAWAGLGDTWMICGKCNRDLYNGRLVRAEIFPRFTTYQGHMKEYIGVQQLSLLELQGEGA